MHQHHPLSDVCSSHPLQGERDALSGLSRRDPRPGTRNQHIAQGNGNGNNACAATPLECIAHIPLALDGLDHSAMEVAI